MKLLVFFIILLMCTPAQAKKAEVRLYRLDCGRIMVRDAHLLDSALEKGAALTLANSCYLIKHADEWLMWDTGLPDAWADVPVGITSKWSGKGPLELFVDKTIESQLLEIGLRFEDVKHVGFSNLMFAHTGNANKFKHATWWVQAAEYEAAKNLADPLGRYRLVRFKDIENAKRHLLTDVKDVFGDGSVMMLPAAGHSAGHQILLVRLKNNGVVVLGGDTAVSSRYWSAKGVQLMAVDGDTAAKTYQEVNKLAEDENAQLWFSHDIMQAGFIDSAPAYLD